MRTADWVSGLNQTNNEMKPSQLYKKLFLSFISLIVTLFILEFAARISMPFHAPVLLRDGIYVNSLPLVTGVAPPTLLSNLPKGERLPEKKPAGEIRIFVYGESSVQGVILDENASAPTMLYDMLTKAYPHRSIKVINMGRTASICPNVYYYLLYTKRYAPDFIIFYMGTNDGFGMPGEHCWPINHPVLHKLWHWSMNKSWLLWSMRVYGPAYLWSFKPRKKNNFNFNWNCPADPFSKWTDVLVKTASLTGAKVIVTTPVQSAVASVESVNYPNKEVSKKSDSMTAIYRKLLLCRLTNGCDFISRFKTYVSYDNMKEIPDKISSLRTLMNIPKKGEQGDTSNNSGSDTTLINILKENNIQKFYNYSVSFNKSLLDDKAKSWLMAANRYKAAFIDFRSALTNASPHKVLADKFFADEVHLKPEGYYYLASFWFEHIRAELGGVKPREPDIPTYDKVKNYYKASKITGMSMLLSYLKVGRYLISIPGLEMISKHCPTGECDERAAIALGWLRQKAGLKPGVPKELTEKVKTFDPAKWQY